ncbi:MAG: hypothetical protein ACO20H_00310 [Bacteriovoracaceae bacterium]
MGKQKNIILSEKGQSAVEYILLLAVVMSLVMVVFRNQTFQHYMGPDSPYFQTLRKYIEHSYRYGSPVVTGLSPLDSNGYSDQHTSYLSESGQSRFFTPLEPTQ